MKVSLRRADRSHRVQRVGRAAIALAIGAAPSIAKATDPTAGYWTGLAGTGNWEDAGNWSVDASGSIQSIPPADDGALRTQISNVSGSPATSNFKQSTMDWYVDHRGTAQGAALHIGTLIIGEGSTDGAPDFGTLNFSGGTLSASSFYVGGWSLNNHASGTLIISGGVIGVTGSLTVGNEDSTTPSHGTILMSGGEIDYGSQTISFGNRESTGAVFVSGGLINGTGLVTIGGSTITSGSTSTSAGVGSLNISASGQLIAGSIEFNTGRPSKTILALNDNLSIAGGTLSVGSLGQGVGTIGLVCGVSFTGGTVTANTFRMTLNQQGGTLSPGAGGALNGGTSVGSINLLDDSTGKQAGPANYTQAAGAHLLLDVGSVNGSLVNDAVHLENNSNAPQTATLNGQIDINVKPGYTPTPNDTFNVLTADTINDNSAITAVNDAPYIFTKAAPLTGQSIPKDLSGGMTSNVGSILQIKFLGYAKPGDANRDQTVNSSDFDRLAGNFGKNGEGWTEGDFNGDGIVNALDFNALASHYGATGFSTTPTADIPDDAIPALGSIVPEPMSTTMLLSATGLLFIVRNRRRSI